jgi:Flp pilus assembly protein TadG
MKSLPYQASGGRRHNSWESGQAIVEFAICALLLFTLAFGLVDFGRAIYQKEVITNLTREGSNLASRGTSLNDAATAVVNGANPLNLSTSGYVIITSVVNNSGTYNITGQVSQGGISARSKVGTGVGNNAVLPAGAVASGQTVYVTEVFCSYQAVTPIGKLLGFTLPSTLYDVAYF